MSEKRMFAKAIVLSDAFLDMPATSRCLYFTLNMMADDDGFVDAPKSIMRQCGATDDDMRVLIGKKFVIPFESGVIVIKHWRINNYLRKDRYTPTKHTREMAELTVKENGAYKVNQEEIEAPKKLPLTERVPKNDLEKVEKVYLENYEQLFKSGVLKQEKPVINWSASRKLTKDCIAKYGLEQIVSAVRKSIDNKFCVTKGYVLTTILSAGVLSQLINTTDGRIDNDSISVGEIEF